MSLAFFYFFTTGFREEFEVNKQTTCILQLHNLAAMKNKRLARKREPVVPRKAEVSVEGLIEQANVALSNVQPELASKFFKRALMMSPDDTSIMDALADAYIQMGDTDSALKLLRNSTAQAPDTNPYKWMYMGQLLCGTESLSCFLTGIQKLTLPIQTDHNPVIVTSFVGICFDPLGHSCICCSYTAVVYY